MATSVAEGRWISPMVDLTVKRSNREEYEMVETAEMAEIVRQGA